MIKIGVDLSGGDFAPARILEGAALARAAFKQVEIVGFIAREDIPGLLPQQRSMIKSFTLVEAEEKIAMDEKSTASVRNKKDSTISVGLRYLKEGAIDAFVSCGNTGAVVCAATLGLGMIEHVERPGIGLFVPTRRGAAFLIDAGANIDAKPEHLLQYGLMSQVYFNRVFNKENVSVGLLNIGEEETKGTDFIKQAHKLFSGAQLNFIGNVEPKDMFAGKCDCVICDGFVGNITLKVTEGVADVLKKILKEHITRNLWRRIGLFFLQNAFQAFKKQVDYAEYGGAPLLGVKGVVIIGHGRSNKYAVRSAIRVAVEEVERNVLEAIKERMNECS